MGEELEELKNLLPKEAAISEYLYEGSNIVFYTNNKDFFVNCNPLIKELVSKIKKRIEVRPSQLITTAKEEAEKKIRKIIPKEAGLEKIVFLEGLGKVILRARKPGIAIGKNGSNLENLKREIFWLPVVKRIPAIESKIVEKGIELTLENPKFRKEFLNEVGSKIRLQKSAKSDWIRITALGGYRQVGRSCTLLQTENSKVLIDCGVGFSANGLYPYLNIPEFRIEELDAVIVSHAHMDHVGFVPYLYEYGYKGPVYCTEPTRDLLVLLQLDFLDVVKREGKKAPYSSNAIKKQIMRCITPNLGGVYDITPDMRITFHKSGHILGSASVHIHIGEGLHNLVYTGDYKFGRTELFDHADNNFTRVETLITESTYGGKSSIMPIKGEANARFLEIVKKTIERKGKAIIPSFSVGRAQEAMILLYKYVEEQNIPVYLDGMIWDATALHTAYPEYLSKELQKKIFHYGENPFLCKNFIRVGGRKERANVIEDNEPCVILTTSGMINGGPILSYLEHLCSDEKNSLIIIGYQASGTLGRKIQMGLTEFPVNGEKTVPIKMEVKTIHGLSAHSDKRQIMSYVGKLPNRPGKIICVHGDEDTTLQLASSLHKVYKVETLAPQNLETIRLV